MGLYLKTLEIFFLFFCGWGALSQETDCPGAVVEIDPDTIATTAKKSMSESNIVNELAEAATKNKGGAKAIKGIKGLKVEDIRPPNITITFIKDVGCKMDVITQITIAGKSFIGGTMKITVRSNMKTTSEMSVVSETEMGFRVLKCEVELLSCKTNLPSSMLPKIVNKFLNSTLGKVLPGMMCPAANKVIAHMKDHMLSVFEPCDCGGGVSMQYVLKDSLKITDSYVDIHFKAKIKTPSGELIDVSCDPPAALAPPEKENGVTNVIISVNILNAFIKVVESDFQAEIESDLGGEPGTAHVTVKDSPVHTLAEGKSTLVIRICIQISAGSIDLVVTFGTTFEVVEEKLKINVEAESVSEIVQESTNIEEDELLHFMTEEYSSVLRVPEKLRLMCLPSMMGASYGNASVSTYENALVMRVISE